VRFLLCHYFDFKIMGATGILPISPA